jgi:hypothetical protein
MEGENEDVRRVRNRLESGSVTSTLKKEVDYVSRALLCTGKAVTVQKTAIYSKVKV